MLTRLPNDNRNEIKNNVKKDIDTRNNVNKTLTTFGKSFARGTKNTLIGTAVLSLGLGVVSHLSKLDPALTAELYKFGVASGLGAGYCAYTERIMEK